MTGFATWLRSPAAAARTSAGAALSAHRRRALDFRGRESDDDVVARFETARYDFGEAAVGDAGANFDGRQLLLLALSRFHVHGLRLRRARTRASASSARHLARGAGGSALLPALRHAAHRIAAGRRRRTRAFFGRRSESQR